MLAGRLFLLQSPEFRPCSQALQKHVVNYLACFCLVHFVYFVVFLCSCFSCLEGGWAFGGLAEGIGFVLGSQVVGG